MRFAMCVLPLTGRTFFMREGFEMERQTREIKVVKPVAMASFSPRIELSLLPDTGVFTVFPGFCDVHVHFREPGFSYKETIRSGSLAAARGGYTAVCTMPNLDPVPDSAAHLAEELAIIRRDAAIRVLPYGALTAGEKGKQLADLQAMAKEAVAFSDDGKGVQSESMMRAAMEEAKRLGKVLAAHCEDESLLRGGYIHDGEYAKAHGHRGIPAESEWGPIQRDLRLAKETGCAYHVCHVSAKESVALIREAKKEGVDVTCETAPHYLLLTDADLREEGRFKMNPPLRSEEDRETLLEGLLDGTVDMIATDHAPHSAEEKAGGLEKSAFGIVGLETAFSLLYTRLVRPGILSMDRLLEALTVLPRQRFGIPLGEDYTVWDLEEGFTVNPAEFLSKGRATPFAGERLLGRCKLTAAAGKIAYREKD